MRPNVFDYVDFREFLQAMVNHLKTTDGFTVRSFATASGFGSSSYLKMIIDGKRRLTPKAAQKICRAFKLTRDETRFFLNLTRFCQSSHLVSKEAEFQGLMKFKKFRQRQKVNLENFKLFSRWFMIPLLEAYGTPARSRSLHDWAMRLQVSEATIQKALQLFKSMGLIEPEGENFKRVGSILEADLEAKNFAIRVHHIEMIKRALRAAETLPASERELGSLTIPLSKKAFESLRERLREWQQDTAFEFQNEGSPDSVYQLNLQLFPILDLKDEANEL